MKNFRVSIQEKIRAFDENGLVGETSMEKIEDYCKANGIKMPLVWNEQDSQTIEIIKNYFQDK
ncbi:MAG: hypothetical protein IBX44_10235 [Sulfurospirillum sp.]|nr:hypothetical protein [Sulfurospirillum sp.]